ncbi:hypothetical protein MsAg5_02340 [Methanosarcinaceae archaeon Ag5]|uniref:ATP-binding protein n=1 Tax=Methanolapillus africanus TaxID=3028297 RepID=A0AAE4MI27_9EURY|nr:hypothetical protein [Methanosarcinaceae archaeon Ag5]
MFIGRENELKKLEEMYRSGKFECAVIYGRRRVGKTSLIQEFCKNKKSIYFVAIEAALQNNLSNLSDSIFSVTMPGVDGTPVFEKLEKVFDYLYGLAQKEHLVFVIDEYPYLAHADRSVSSILQAYIDQKFKNTNMMLILCGSSMSFMENQVLGYQSPLYGRRTAQFKINPFDYRTSAQFCRNYSHTEKALVYGITGGVPQYLERIDTSKSLRENIISEFLDPSGYFFEEPSNLLKQELREPQLYNTIIAAIANGASKMNEIATAAGIETSLCSIYLSSLISLGILEKEKPVGEAKSKKSIYKIADNMFRFWYRFVPSNMNAIVSGNGNLVFEKMVDPYLSDYMGGVFEQMGVEYLNRMNGSDQLPFLFSEIGRWWGTNPKRKEEVEMDIVAVSRPESKALFGECKFKNEPVDTDVLERLMENSLLLNYEQKYYILFSKSGFSNKLKKTSPENVILIDLKKMYE